MKNNHKLKPDARIKQQLRDRICKPEDRFKEIVVTNSASFVHEGRKNKPELNCPQCFAERKRGGN